MARHAEPDPGKICRGAMPSQGVDLERLIVYRAGPTGREDMLRPRSFSAGATLLERWRNSMRVFERAFKRKRRAAERCATW